MRILTLTSSYPKFAGDSTAPFIELMTRHVAALGHEVHVVLPEHRDLRRSSVEEGIHYHPYRYSPSRSWTPWGYAASLEAGLRIRRPLYALAPLVVQSALRSCNTLMSELEFDVVHAHWVVPNGLIGARICRRSRTPFVVSLHGSDVTLSARSKVIGALTRRSLRDADVVTAASTYVLDRAQQLGVSRDALEMLPYGVEVDRFRPDSAKAAATRTQLGVEPDEILVLGIGRLVSWKGFEYLLEATAIARARFAGIRLAIVGDGDLRPELERQAAESGLDGAARFVGSVAHTDVPGYFAAADVVVVPSIYHEAGFFEALGNVALEAQATGKPVIASRVGGLIDVVRHEVDGLLVHERDSNALADAITELAGDPERRDRMGSAGRERAVGSLTWEHSARCLEGIYDRACGNTKRAGRVTPSAPRTHTPHAAPGVLYFGTYEQDYPRNAQVISCLRAAGVSVRERHVSVWEGQRHKFAPGIRTVGRALVAQGRLAAASDAEADVLIVGYPGHLDMAAAQRVAGGRPIVFNPLVSLEDTMVGDRRLVRSHSPVAMALHAVDRYAFRHADLVVTDTAAHGRYLAEHFGLSDERVEVCFVGAEDELFQPGPRGNGPFSVLFVGKLIPLHGIDVILGAARQCPDVAFRIVGSGQLDRLLAHLPPNARWERWVEYEQLPELYRAAGCALGIFGTTEKTARVIPNKAFQALATETPLITGDTPAARELLEDGRNALLVPVGDADALAVAIRRLADDTLLRQRLSAEGRATYTGHASEPVLGQRWRAALERLVHRGD